VIDPDAAIGELSIDSRTIISPESTLFFCFNGSRKNGIDYIPELIDKGVRNFIVLSLDAVSPYLNQANFVEVDSVTKALQEIAQYKRKQFHYPVIGITGSNGKTIVKEWLSQLLEPNFSIVKSPKSYNSQIGVPLSIWNMSEQNTLGVFEVGISKMAEMNELEPIVRPTIGIFTNIGDAHQEGFPSLEAKIDEKLQLFIHAEVIIYSTNDKLLSDRISLFAANHQIKTLTWGTSSSDLAIEFIDQKLSVTIPGSSTPFLLDIPSQHAIYIENIAHCITTAYYLGVSMDEIAKIIPTLQKINMRLELIDGFGQSKIINDSYNSDIISIRAALDFLHQQSAGKSKILVLSDIMAQVSNEQKTYEELFSLIQKNELKECIFIGPTFAKYPIFSKLPSSVSFFKSTEEFIKQFPREQIAHKIVLLKGARSFEFEKIARWLEEKSHKTYLEIKLNHIIHNLNYFARLLNPNTRIMLMLKANGYGLGSVETAKFLEHQKADYFAVAYLDEGIELRREGVKTPIMIMNSNLDHVDKFIRHQLEPEIYSLFSLKKLLAELETIPTSTQKIGIHIKLETGMNRLGFQQEDIDELTSILYIQKNIEVKTIFSHLAASDDPLHDDFTTAQCEQFFSMAHHIENKIGYTVIKHILNTGGIIRHSKYQGDMVRLGIGLIGLDSTGITQKNLKSAVSLKSTISQIKKVRKADSVGYSRNGKLSIDSFVAIIELGYADGFLRKFGNGNAEAYIGQKRYPTIGNICMDMTMINLGSDSSVQEGDEVELFGDHIPIETLAKKADTISYEILTSISSRVKRVFVQE
jgi:alanine racemase